MRCLRQDEGFTSLKANVFSASALWGWHGKKKKKKETKKRFKQLLLYYWEQLSLQERLFGFFLWDAGMGEEKSMEEAKHLTGEMTTMGRKRGVFGCGNARFYSQRPLHQKTMLAKRS